MRQHPGVQDVTVVGWPSTYRGETVKAFVVSHPAAREALSGGDIIDFCRARIAPFKAPTLVEFLPELPRNVMGKTPRRLLRTRAGQD
ncbi:AMP-binding enzyme [Camelimonas fluminis]|uniref:AMP-binding enzyme n=1 Tax=Camelimonas fluminis TaxID=1576911 RepID=UPI0035712108